MVIDKRSTIPIYVDQTSRIPSPPSERPFHMITERSEYPNQGYYKVACCDRWFYTKYIVSLSFEPPEDETCEDCKRLRKND